MKKRHLLSGVMALLVSVALSACGGDKNAGGTSAGETKQEASAEETSNTLSEGTPVPVSYTHLPAEPSSAMHFTERERAPQTLSSPAAPNHDKHTRDERLIYTPYHPVRWPYRRRPHLLN